MKGIESYEEGRICHHSDCKVRLSIYNSTEYCTIHQSELLKAEEYLMGKMKKASLITHFGQK